MIIAQVTLPPSKNMLCCSHSFSICGPLRYDTPCKRRPHNCVACVSTLGQLLPFIKATSFVFGKFPRQCYSANRILREVEIIDEQGITLMDRLWLWLNGLVRKKNWTRESPSETERPCHRCKRTFVSCIRFSVSFSFGKPLAWIMTWNTRWNPQAPPPSPFFQLSDYNWTRNVR